jgi:hypothetical protein
MDILTTEEIDNIIKAEIFRLNPHNGVKGPKKGLSWREEQLFLRRQEIMKLYGKGMTKMSIMNEIMRRWDCKKGTAYNYIEDAIDFIVESYKGDADKLKDVIMHRLESLAEDALDSRDRKSALKAYDQISKLAGLYEEKVKVEADTTIKFDFGGDN